MATAFDRRRVQAPESSYPITYAPSESDEAGPSRRTDRKNDESRPIFLKTGLITRANGSGYIESGAVKIACAVFGPRPKQPPYSPEGSLNLDLKFAPFASQPRRAPLRDTEPAPLAATLTAHLLPAVQLHLLPKSMLDVNILVLESDSVFNVLSAALTAASAAIADAGIPMNALAVGSTATLQGEQVLVDPEAFEELSGKDGEQEATVSLGVMPALGKLSGVSLTGEVDIDAAVRLIEQAATSAKSTHTILAQALIEGAEERGIIKAEA